MRPSAIFYTGFVGLITTFSLGVGFPAFAKVSSKANTKALVKTDLKPNVKQKTTAAGRQARPGASSGIDPSALEAGVAPPEILPEQNMPENQALAMGIEQISQLMQPFLPQGYDSNGNYLGNRGFDSQYDRDRGSLSADAGDCGSLPMQVASAYREAAEYKQRCRVSSIAADGKIAINDYSASSGRTYMYIFDSGGRCLLATPVSSGEGNEGGKSMASREALPCSGYQENYTPPGMHVTTYHDTALYPANECLGLAPLEGQELSARGILIHGVSSAAAGYPVTWGCSGVSDELFPEIRSMLGYGSLVYNYFGAKSMVSGCSNSAGMSSMRSCQDPNSGGKIPMASGQGAVD